MTFCTHRSYGFSLVELLIIVAIVLIIAIASLPMSGIFQSSSQLNESTLQVIQTLRTARERSIAGLNNSRHGVYFSVNPLGKDKYILYQGDSYSGRELAYDREIILAESLHLSSVLPGDEVNFSKGAGLPSASGTIDIVHQARGTKSIVINSLGMIEEEY